MQIRNGTSHAERQKINDPDHHHWLLAHQSNRQRHNLMDTASYSCLERNMNGDSSSFKSIAYSCPDDTYHWKSTASSDVSVNSNDSIDAYPLVEDEDPPEMGDIKHEVKMPNKKQLTPTSIMVVDTISEVKSRV